MKKLNVIISITIVMALIAGSVLAAEDTEKSNRPERAQFRGMRGPGGMGAGHRRGMMGPGGGRPGPMAGRGRMAGQITAILRLAKKLKLSEDQISELSGIATAHKKTMIKQKAERDLAKVDLQNLMRKEEQDISTVREQLMRIASLEVDMKIAGIKVRQEARNILTAEQKAALKKLREDRAAAKPRSRRGAPGRGQNRRGPNPEPGKPRR